MKKIENYIDGNIVSYSSKTQKVYDLSTGDQTAEVVLSNNEDFTKVLKSSEKSFINWSNTTPLKRSRVISKFKEIIEKNIEELAKIVSFEHGKTFEDSKGSVIRGLEVLEFASGIPHLLKGEFSQNVGTNIDSWSVRQPLGITAGITPFNFPAMVPMWMYPISIACGNVFILKPSEKDPSCGLKLAELFSEAGLPDGVFNVINGDKEVVDLILNSEKIASVSFVGSTPVAKYIYEKASFNKKRVQALGGAKNHLIVMPDANIDQAVDGIMGAAYGSAGERCMAQSVAVAVGKIGNQLVNKLAKKVESLKIGPGLDKNSEMGPLVTKQHLEKVRGYVDLGVKEGAKLIVDGRNIKLQGYEKGFYIGGCLFDNVDKKMRIYKEEIFGPVLSVVRVKDFKSAVDLVNDHELGNGTSIYTRDGDVGRTFASKIKIGMVGINIPIPVPVAYHSFGGWKRSLFGDQHMHGPEGVRFYTKLKTITSKWPTGLTTDPDFVMPTLN